MPQFHHLRLPLFSHVAIIISFLKTGFKAEDFGPYLAKGLNFTQSRTTDWAPILELSDYGHIPRLDNSLKLMQ